MRRISFLSRFGLSVLVLLIAHRSPAAEVAPDLVKFAGLTPDEAVKAMTLPPGFKATVFAAEPDIVQPIAFCIDDRGRLWVVEGNTYPQKAPEGKGKDRILIFEDSKGTGHFDKRTVFIDGLNLVSGIEVGFGGVWVGQAPQLLFIPILEGDKPGKPEVLLDGFAYNDTHETLNSFNWGPDGWLYGCHGVFNSSKVGKPGTPEKERVHVTAAVWRFHPTRKVFEVFAEGGSNQWGIDWDEHGQMFMTCCVIPHLYHVIPGGRYVRQAGPHTDPYTFGDIKTIADHLHWDTGAGNQWAANGKSSNLGGGHAHAGCMIYQGDNFPPEYRGKIFMGNIHGNRINTDELEPKGSGFVAHHGKDFLLMNDKWSRLISMKYGPDGGVYIIDWYDKQACHLNKPEVWDRSNGRIYKITYGETKGVKVDLAKMKDVELVALQTHDNEWYARHARRLLQERHIENLSNEAKELSFKEFSGMSPDTSSRLNLRALWQEDAVMGGFPSGTAEGKTIWMVLGNHAYSKDEHLRAAALKVLSDIPNTEDLGFFGEYQKFAEGDASPVVRLSLAAAMQKSGSPQRWGVMETLLTHAEDATDQNLPLMYWYAIAPLISTDVNRAAKLAVDSKIPLVREYIARRLAMGGFAAPVAGPSKAQSGATTPGAEERRPGGSDLKNGAGVQTEDPGRRPSASGVKEGAGDSKALSPDGAAMGAIVEALGRVTDGAAQLDILKGMIDGLAGRRSAPMPANWQTVYDKLAVASHADVKQKALAIATIFGDPRALAILRQTAGNPRSGAAQRLAALDALLAAKDPQLSPILQKLITDPVVALRAPAIRGLAAYDDAATPKMLLDLYPSLDELEKRDALNTLAARKSSATALLAALQAGNVPKADLTAPTIRNLSSLDDAAVNQWIATNWGTVRATAADKVAEINRLKKILTPAALDKADPNAGHVTFTKTCQQCHTLFGEGAKIGPDLTGSNRADVNYLLENIVDPSAVIGKDYLLTLVKTTDGRSIDGIIKSQTDATVTIATTTELLALPRTEIKSMKVSTVSMMPEGLLSGMSDKDVRDLIAFLGRQKK